MARCSAQFSLFQLPVDSHSLSYQQKRRPSWCVVVAKVILLPSRSEGKPYWVCPAPQAPKLQQTKQAKAAAAASNSKGKKKVVTRKGRMSASPCGRPHPTAQDLAHSWVPVAEMVEGQDEGEGQ